MKQTFPSADEIHQMRETLDVAQTSRRTRRLVQRLIPGADGARATGRATGRPAHFSDWKRQAEVKRHLQKMKTSWLAEQLQAQRHGAAPVLFLLAKPFPNVWALSQATREAILAVPGVGPKRLRKLQEYLEEHQVKIVWRDGD